MSVTEVQHNQVYVIHVRTSDTEAFMSSLYRYEKGHFFLDLYTYSPETETGDGSSWLEVRSEMVHRKQQKYYYLMLYSCFSLFQSVSQSARKRGITSFHPFTLADLYWFLFILA